MSSDPDDLSDRLIFQRIRNRTIEVLHVLAEGPGGVVHEGTIEWINGFFDWVDDRSPRWRDNTAMTAGEVDAVARVQPVAHHAVDLMLARGRFDEDVEQAEPARPARG